MATYGNYETVGRIYSIGARSVYSARAVGKPKDEFVIKVVSAEDVFGEDPEAVLREFTQRAKIQQKLSEAKSKSWAVVYEVGQRDGEVYYVTDRAASNAQQLVAGKVRTEGADLYRVISRVVEALRELRSSSARAHANLKPSNILIDRAGDVATAGITVTDPSGADQPNPGLAEHADVKDVGDLIHQMVLHAPFRAMGGYPIEDSPGWARLGKSGPQWRALCNRMLDPAAVPGSITIESLAGEIESLKAKASTGGPKPVVLIGAAVGLALLAGGVAIAWPSISKMLGGKAGDGPTPVRFDAQAWRQWCERAQWALALRDELRRRSAEIDRDEYLRTALAPLAAEEVELDPRQATPEVRARRYQMSALMQEPPPEASNPQGAAATVAALDWIARVEAALSPEQWSATRTLRATEQRLTDLKWDRFAEYPRLLSGRLANRDDAGRLVVAVIDVARVAPSFDRLLTAIESAQPGREDQVPVQARMINQNADMLAGVQVSHIDALVAYISNPANNVRAPVVIASNTPPGGNQSSNQGNNTANNGGTDHNNTTLPVTPDNPNGQGTSSQIPDPNGTVIETQTPPVIDIGPDPRQHWGVPGALDAVRSRLREPWVAELQGASVVGATGALADAESIAQTVQRVGELEWTEATRDQVRDGMAEAQSRLELVQGVAEQLHRDYESARAAAAQSAAEAAAQAERDHADFVREFELRTPAVLRSPYLTLQWEFLRAQIVRNHEEPAQLPELRNAASQLERAIAMAESGIPMPALPDAGPAGFDAAGLTAYFTQLREAALERAWQIGGQDAFGDNFQAACQTQRSELAAAADLARRFAADMLVAQAALDAAAGWDEPLSRSEPPETLARIFQRWTAQPPPDGVLALMGQAPQRLSAVAGLVGTLADASTASASDLATLQSAVTSDQTPLTTRLYTWRALRANTAITLEAEQAMLTGLRAALPSITSEPRRNALRAEFDQTALARWTSAMEAAQSRAQFESAFAARTIVEGGANLTALSARTQFNLGLVLSVQRLEQLGPAATDDQVREVLQRIVDTADRDPALWQSDAATAAWIASVRAALNQTGGADVNVLAGRGPGSAGGNWSFQALDPQANRIRYSTSAGGVSVALEFVRLDPGTDRVGQSAYLSTTEISLGVFGAVANASGAWGRIATAWGERLTNNDDSWDGPKPWMYLPSVSNRLGLNNRWLSVQGTGSFNIPRPFATAPDPPSLDLPVQLITAPAARTFAQAAGCRLPTSQEWQAAQRRESGSGWNLRDAAWVTQRDFAAQRQARPPLWPFPDAGAFVPNGREVAIEADAQPAPGANDGVLYFQPVDVGAGSTFRHIVGNVAEFVDDSPAGFAGPEESRSYRVIGGSAISAPELGVDQPLPMVTDARDNYMVPTNFYADVGFRLAFDAGPLGAGPPMAQQARDLAAGLSLVRAR